MEEAVQAADQVDSAEHPAHHVQPQWRPLDQPVTQSPSHSPLNPSSNSSTNQQWLLLSQAEWCRDWAVPSWRAWLSVLALRSHIKLSEASWAEAVTRMVAMSNSSLLNSSKWWLQLRAWQMICSSSRCNRTLASHSTSISWPAWSKALATLGCVKPTWTCYCNAKRTMPSSMAFDSIYDNL